VTAILIGGGAFAALSLSVGAIGMALPGIITAVELFAKEFPLLASEIKAVAVFLTGPWGIAILAVIGGLVLLWEKNEAFRNKVKEVADMIMGYVKPVFDGMVEWLKNAGQHWDEIKEKQIGFKDQIMENQIVIRMIDLVKDAFSHLWEKIKDELWPVLKQLWATLKDELWPALKDLWEAIQPLMPLFEMWLKVIGILMAAGLVVLIQAITKLAEWLVIVLRDITLLTDFIVKIAVAVFKEIKVKIDETSASLKVWIEWIEKAINKWKAFKDSGASLNPFSSSFKIPGIRASGGSVSPGRSFIVGENGPELFSPSSYGQITRNSQISGGGGITVNVYGDVSGHELIDKVKRGIMNELKLNAQV
jgi:hypothetical protein